MASSNAMTGILRSVPALNTQDPLGLDVKQRGLAAYNAAQAKRDPRFLSGPLPDPKWAGFFQALDDAGVKNVAQEPDVPNPMADAAPGGDVGHLSYTGDTINGGPLMQSTNLATVAPSLRGLKKAVR